LHQHYITLRRDGTFEVNGILHEPDKVTPFTWRGTWHVKDRKFIYTTTYSRPAGMYKIGETFQDTIEEVSNKEWVMLEESTNARSRAYRVD
jgi:hypothetical protein